MSLAVGDGMEWAMHGLPAAGRPMLHPLNAIILAFPVALFTGGLVSDLAYLRTSEIQWSNFSAWMITSALVFGGVALAWSVLGLILPRRAGRRRAALYALLLAVGWLAGLINAFQHSRDGWSSVGGVGVALSVVSTAAFLVAAWIGFSAGREAAR